ncbi:MAG: hypothetical protein D6732_10075 [Methanobacteriota archaeon]|nr:MAG: hypothetical protein D6732_10075 [Euryarchaeota archaeon]
MNFEIEHNKALAEANSNSYKKHINNSLILIGEKMIVAIRAFAALVLIYCGWIIFRVVDDWLGAVAAVISLLLLPFSIIVMPFLMLFIPSDAAGPLSLWPAIILFGILDRLASARGSSLLIR